MEPMNAEILRKYNTQPDLLPCVGTKLRTDYDVQDITTLERILLLFGRTLTDQTDYLRAVSAIHSSNSVCI